MIAYISQEKLITKRFKLKLSLEYNTHNIFDEDTGAYAMEVPDLPGRVAICKSTQFSTLRFWTTLYDRFLLPYRAPLAIIS
ncbi:MAG: hypothetical protein LBG12_03835 [Synergistaceae bacterium]|jgi:hypothetical protein|nr:hypothetical protein [Synergistaceae bacterium]